METVKIKSVKKLNKKEDVYNLEVDKYHNFAVNGGFIVHNCLDALRYACENDMLGATITVGKRAF